MFFYNVARYADVYTASINNFLRYSLDHCFYAGRQYLPHELPFPDPAVLTVVERMHTEEKVMTTGPGGIKQHSPRHDGSIGASSIPQISVSSSDNIPQRPSPEADPQVIVPYIS